jgi:hypothetical protein
MVLIRWILIVSINKGKRALLILNRELEGPLFWSQGQSRQSASGPGTAGRRRALISAVLIHNCFAQ